MKIKLKRSLSTNADGSAKQPTKDQMEYGELAVNYNRNDPALFIKDDNDQIIRIAGDNAIGNDTEDIEGYPDLEDGNGTTLDGRYVKLSGDDTAQVITGTGGLKTEGLIETEGGVKLTGGEGTDAHIYGEDYGTDNERIGFGISDAAGFIANKKATAGPLAGAPYNSIRGACNLTNSTGQPFSLVFYPDFSESDKTTSANFHNVVEVNDTNGLA